MIQKSASVHWEGQGKAGQGQISTESGALQDQPYGFGSRFEDDRKGSNPEELLGAAHAACFTMAFSFACAAKGFDTRKADTKATVYLDKVGDGYRIDRIDLELRALIPGIDAQTFQQLAVQAKNTCPLSRALASVPRITLIANLLADEEA
ncbi:MAG TPA: OsmC family protein [Candidatus Aquabacterium excrementipullorum]|nr:OsmC family protein [Candidatus Aquabacterium excrementipullorum]